MKSFSKALLELYVLFLLWLVLFKTSTDFSSVLLHYQSRSLNLIPFASYAHGAAREMIDNLVVFIPLGLLLGVNLKHVSFWRKLAFIFGLSFVLEILQYLLAIGATDINDVILNTAGGLFGLALYALNSKYLDNKKLDRCIAAVVAILLTLILLFRFLVLHVRY
jgi:glycopeptide antibiotics resistance protein